VKYVVRVCGERFKGSWRRRIGFYTTRKVEAVTAETIDRDALFRSILSELESGGVITTPGSRMWIEEYWECPPQDDDRNFAGFSFFLEGT
jgi:hypothetical protein